MKKILEKDGTKIHTGVKVKEKVKEVEAKKQGVIVKYSIGDKAFVEEADYIYLATGRKPLLKGLGLENIGVKISSKGYIVVDEYLRAAENVYAAGDCINNYMLEPVAVKEGFIAALNALGENIKIDCSVIPRAVFTDPEFARVGYTEEEFSKITGSCSCRIVELKDIPKARILGYEGGFIKIVI